jgi:hypothetical protein
MAGDMILPIDNSTDLPLRYISEATVEDEYGSLLDMSKPILCRYYFDRDE